MPTKRKRILDFRGNDHAYLSYLYQLVRGLPLRDCIRDLEEQVKEQAQVQCRGQPLSDFSSGQQPLFLTLDLNADFEDVSPSS